MKEVSFGADDELIRTLVLGVAKALADRKDGIRIDMAVEDKGITLTLMVAPSDLGKMIGKEGRTARSIRTIMSGAGMKMRKRYMLNIQADATQE